MKPKKVDGEACTKKIKDLIVTEKRFSMDSIFLEPKKGNIVLEINSLMLKKI